MFARGFTLRTRIIIVVGALYILSSIAMIAGMILAMMRLSTSRCGWGGRSGNLPVCRSHLCCARLS